MKKSIIRLALLISTLLLLSSCYTISNLATSNQNLNQTSVVLSQKNFHIVKTVSASMAHRRFGAKKEFLYGDLVAQLTEKAQMTGSQALINITFKEVNRGIIFQKKLVTATATVIEFD